MVPDCLCLTATLGICFTASMAGTNIVYFFFFLFFFFPVGGKGSRSQQAGELVQMGSRPSMSTRQHRDYCLSELPTLPLDTA